MITIGTYTARTSLFLAPLSGWSDLPFRLISRKYGARFCFYEMIDAHALIRKHTATLKMLQTTPEDTPIAGQLLASDPSIAADAAQKLIAAASCAFIDINCACPVRKVLKKKTGAHLFTDPKLAAAIIRKVSQTISLPVTVKMRVGYSHYQKKDALDFAKRLIDAGAQALFIHGRTKAEGYSGDIHYDAIAAIKDAVSVPVIGSGNIWNVSMAHKMFHETNCDGILIARGAFGNPWIFREIHAWVAKKRIPEPPSFEERITTALEHLSYIEQYNQDSPLGKLGTMRRLAQWYLKGFPHATRLRHHITSVQSYRELITLIRTISQTP